MTMKSVELNAEDSKEFVELLKRDAGADEINTFLDGKADREVPPEVIPTLEKLAQLDQLQEDELTVLARIATVRREIQGELVEMLLAGPQDVKTDGALDDRDPPFAPPEETSPISTDQKTPS